MINRLLPEQWVCSMLPLKRLDHLLVCIPEGTTANARTFYGQLLELPEIPGQHPGRAIWFRMADIELHLREEAGTTARSKRHAAFEVTDLETARRQLTGKGIALEQSSEIDGRARLFFYDPFGNRFELLQYQPNIG